MYYLAANRILKAVYTERDIVGKAVYTERDILGKENEMDHIFLGV